MVSSSIIVLMMIEKPKVETRYVNVIESLIIGLELKKHLKIIPFALLRTGKNM